MDDPVFLYVEDDTFSRQVFGFLMQRVLGYQYLTVFEDSLDFATRIDTLEPKPTVVFLDVHVEPLDGFAMLDILRQHPDYQHTHIVALTASVMNEEVIQLHEAGFDSGLAKPIDQSMFPALLERILHGERVWHIV